MGICDSAQNQSHSHNNNSTSTSQKKEQTNIEQQNNPANSYSLTEPIQIVNRLSEKSKFADINKYISITDVFLGKGATGIVREGTNSKGEKFAVKTVWKADVDQNECFKREIDITLELNNENVIHCEEIYEDNSAIHFVLELISGGDLFDHIIHSSNRKLSENEAMDLLQQMLSALHYLHDEINIVHRDIKPENFLMYNKNGKNYLKLIDFGFAEYCKPNEFMKEQLGTPQYAAPEIFEEKPYTNKVDIWSTGVVLYNMINGMQPFSSNINTIKEQVLTREIDFSGFSNQGLKELCQSMLERDPNKRLSAFQALEKLNLIGGGNISDQTVPSNFIPDIQKIMVILNDRALTDELRNLFLDKLSYLDIVKVFKDFKKNSIEENDKDLNDMMTGNIYMKAGQLIDKALKLDYLKDDFKNILKQFRDNKGEEKVMRQMINVSKFFITALESKKFIRKQRCLNTFKNYDKNRGYLTYYQINQIFTDKIKKDRLKNSYNQNSKIYFEDFYQMWNKYDDVVYDEELRNKSKKNLLK